MKNKLLCSVLLIALVMSLAACGDGGEETEASKQVMESEQQSSETVTNDIPILEERDEFTAEDYQNLAQQYQEQGLIRKQRDVLEKSYRLYNDQTAFERLQTISVNLAEEDEAVREQANLMLQNLELEEYLGESINLISTQEWFQTMMPKLREGYRSYFLQKDGQTLLYIQAGYTRTGEVSAKVWYFGEQVKVLRREGNTLQLLETQMTEGHYQGAFESWTLDGGSGDIYHETGTFGNGVITGAYKISIHEGTQSSDLFSLWSNKEGMSYTTYTGTFDDRGISMLEQPAEKKIASLISGTEYNSCIVYAIDINDCLFEGLAAGEEPATYVFGIEKMGWEMCPSFTVYEPVEDPAPEKQANTEISVRVFDGELQIYQNDGWMGLGSIEEYIQADPFCTYQNNGQEKDGEPGMTGYRRNTGTLPKDKVVTKPATQAPAQQQVPQEQPQQAPQQSTPAPAPSQPQQTTPPTNNDNGNSNNGNSGNDNSAGGNDGDVEWSDSVL